MRDRDTPLPLVRKWEKMEPGVYEALDRLRGAKDSGDMSWPDYCELPIGAAYTYLMTRHDEPTAAGLCAELTALWTWRRSKKVYSFDRDLARSLADQANDVRGTDVLPCDLLMHLPYPCVYIKAPGVLEHTDGFFVFIEFDVNHNRPELRVQWMFEDMLYTFPQVLHLLPGHTIRDFVLDTIHTTQENLHEDIKLEDVDADIARVILSAIQLVLYLISDNAEIEKAPRPLVKGKTEKNVVRLTKKNADKASQIEEYQVGIRVGAALRKAAKPVGGHAGETGTGKSKRSHTRRGHWHHYWTGPIGGDRTLILKWTAPTVIHPEDIEDNVVVYPVKK